MTTAHPGCLDKETPMINDYTWTAADTAGDCRRATALMLHHLDNHEAGAAAIIDQAHTQGRTAPLILALLDQTLHHVPDLNTEHGRNQLKRAVVRLATIENMSNTE